MKISAVSGTKSCWGSLDTRLSISLETDMPLARNIVLSEEQETRSYSLGTFSLNNEVTISNVIQNTIMSEFHLQSQSRAGSVVLKNADNPITNWVSLAPSTNVRNIRLRLQLRERIFREGTGWAIVTRALPVASHNNWNAKLIFAKRY